MAEVFTEVVVAPGFTPGALDAFGRRKGLRVVRAPLPTAGGLDLRVLPGGALVQDRDAAPETTSADLEVVSAREPSEDEWRDLRFAWTVAMRVKSNAIVFAKDLATVGVGAGQMSRVDASFLAVRKAGDRARGAVMASDAFFPFPDASRSPPTPALPPDPPGGLDPRRRGPVRRRGSRDGRGPHRTPPLPPLTPRVVSPGWPEPESRR
jgi:phosphoribosylaminoimidazolecarboxamide formyltransferase/IMP cyclohydrolase